MRFNSGQIQKIGKEISSKVEGKTLFDEFSRGRYSTDASVYQIKPLGVVLPKDANDVLNIMDYSQRNSIPLLARGGGSSQCGQTVGESVVLDYSKHQNKILELRQNKFPKPGQNKFPEPGQNNRLCQFISQIFCS